MRVSSSVITGGILLLIILVAGGVTWYVISERAANEVAAKRAAHPLRIVSNGTASTSLLDDNGNPTSLTSYADSFTIITSWATWCPSCQEQLAVVATVGERFADQGVTAIAYNRSEPRGTIDAYTSDNPLPKNLVFVRDTTDALFAQFDGYTMPETIIVSPSGDIVEHYRGMVTQATLQQALSTALQE